MRKVASADYHFKAVQKSGRINQRTGFFLALDRFRALRESYVADQSFRNFIFITTKLAPFGGKPDDACESRNEFRACTIKN